MFDKYTPLLLVFTLFLLYFFTYSLKRAGVVGVSLLDKKLHRILGYVHDVIFFIYLIDV